MSETESAERTRYYYSVELAEGAMPVELLEEMLEWCAESDSGHPWQPFVWLEVSSEQAEWLATDGHRMIRATYRSSLPDGQYRAERTTEGWTVTEHADGFPRGAFSASMWESKKPQGPEWSVNVEYFAALRGIERALGDAWLRECPPAGTQKQRAAARRRARERFRAVFALGGELDPIRVRFEHAPEVRALILPRRI